MINFRRVYTSIAIIIAFIGLRAAALGQIYHQDEYKWAQIVDHAYGLQGTIPHPPLGETLYHIWGLAFGYGALRGLPFLISILNLILLATLVYRQWGEKRMIAVIGMLTISLANIIASVQVDIDGSLLIFWTILTWIAYTLWVDERKHFGKWLMLVSLIGGLLCKISYILVIVALLAPKILKQRRRLSKKWILAGIVFCLVGIIFWCSSWIDYINFVQYAKGFGVGNLQTRSFSQLFLLNTKVLVLLGPACILALYGIIKNPKRYQREMWYSIMQILFYDVVFDFTHRTIDRYLLVLCIPVSLVAGDVLMEWLEAVPYKSVYKKILPVTFGIIFTAVLAIPKDILPLHPKNAFIERFFSGDLRFLIPISSGSGPIGFFVPADVITFSMFAVVVATLFTLRHPMRRQIMVPLVSIIIVLYGLTFGIEYAQGPLYGNASRIAKKALKFIQNDAEIKNVITYNDIGGWELGEMKKYYKRFYLNPEFLGSTERRFASFQGHYLVVGMPPISRETKQAKYLETCKNIHQETSGYINATVYDCRGIPYPTEKK